MDYLINKKTGKSYYSQFLKTCGSDIKIRVDKAIKKIEKGNMGCVTKLTMKNETFYAPLYEYEIDYKQGFRIYFTIEHGIKKIMTIGVKKHQKKDVKFCCAKYLETINRK
jgi:putative component of toxin-antitoxin plasmid stabilization module